MQTFLPYEDFKASAHVLDRSRLGKQRVEALQILKVLKQGEFFCWSCHQPVTHFNPYKTGYHCYYCEAPLKKTPWYNHPAIQMWKGYESGLMIYLHAVCHEWVTRGYKDTCWEKAVEIAHGSGVHPTNIGTTEKMPPWLGDKSFHLSHQSNLLRKDPEYYGKYFPAIPSDLPYIWPTKQQ